MHRSSDSATGPLTVFSMPKAFRGHIGIIQQNAMRSWARLRPACEVILFGDDSGTAEAAAAQGARHVPDVMRNRYGTPLLSDMFRKANALATHPVLCYVNADIILMNDLLHAVGRVPWDRFLLIGQRWDLDLREERTFDTPGWEDALRQEARERGSLHGHTGVDYYVFSKGIWGEIPPFAVGRYMYDNWLIWRIRSMNVPVIDATEVVTSIHQNHDRTYSSLGLTAPDGGDNYVRGIEARINTKLAGGRGRRYTLRDATWRLTATRLRRAITPWHLLGRLRTIARHLTSPPAWWVTKRASRDPREVTGEGGAG